MNKGKDTIYLVSLDDGTVGGGAKIIANQTEGSYSIETELVDEQTKFGRLVDYGNTSESFEITAFGDTNDEGQNAILTAIKQKKALFIWEIKLIPNSDGTYPALYARTIVESIEKSTSAEGFEEISTTLQVVGRTYEGVLPEEEVPNALINFATSGFKKPSEIGVLDDTEGTDTP